MAGYKVSYKMLRQQGEELKAVAKLVDGYTERVSQISQKLGDSTMLSGTRQNLQRLREQLLESRTVLNTAGEFLTKNVESYQSVEQRQVKKVDAMKAHNRDFYKNPIVVASAGGAAVGIAVSGVGAINSSTPSTATTTANYTDNSVNITYANADSSVADSSVVEPLEPEKTQNAAVSQPPASTSGVEKPATESTTGNVTAAGVGVLGGAAAAAGSVLGGLQMKKRREAKKVEVEDSSTDQGLYDAEEELAMAIQRVHKLESDD